MNVGSYLLYVGMCCFTADRVGMSTICCNPLHDLAKYDGAAGRARGPGCPIRPRYQG